MKSKLNSGLGGSAMRQCVSVRERHLTAVRGEAFESSRSYGGKSNSEVGFSKWCMKGRESKGKQQAADAVGLQNVTGQCGLYDWVVVSSGLYDWLGKIVTKWYNCATSIERKATSVQKARPGDAAGVVGTETRMNLIKCFHRWDFAHELLSDRTDTLGCARCPLGLLRNGASGTSLRVTLKIIRDFYKIIFNVKDILIILLPSLKIVLISPYNCAYLD